MRNQLGGTVLHRAGGSVNVMQPLPSVETFALLFDDSVLNNVDDSVLHEARFE